MTDLDLDDIRALMRQPHNFHLTLAADKLLAEVERLRAERIEVAEANGAIRELRDAVANFPSSEAYESAIQQLSDARAANDRMYSLLLEILSNFHETGRAGAGEFRYEAVRSGWVRAETFERWRSLAGGRDA